MSRKNLGASILRKIPCSIVGIRDYDGANQKFKDLVARTAELAEEWLQHFCAHPEQGNEADETPLWVAAFYGLDEGGKRLLRSGAFVDRRDQDGTTPLMAAASTGQLSTSKLLLENGANPNLRNRFGVTAISAAFGSSHASVVTLLRTVSTSTTPGELVVGLKLQGEQRAPAVARILEDLEEEVLPHDDGLSSEEDGEEGGEKDGEEESERKGLGSSVGESGSEEEGAEEEGEENGDSDKERTN